jgi:hypothetical protein
MLVWYPMWWKEEREGEFHVVEGDGEGDFLLL